MLDKPSPMRPRMQGVLPSAELRAYLARKFTFDPNLRNKHYAVYLQYGRPVIGLDGEHAERDKLFTFRADAPSEYIVQEAADNLKKRAKRYQALNAYVQELYANPDGPERTQLANSWWPATHIDLVYHPGDGKWHGVSSGTGLTDRKIYLTFPLEGPLPPMPAPLNGEDCKEKPLRHKLATFLQEKASQPSYEARNEQGLERLVNSVSGYPFDFQIIAAHDKVSFVEWVKERPTTRYDNHTGKHYASTTAGQYDATKAESSYMTVHPYRAPDYVPDHEFGHALSYRVGQAENIVALSQLPAWQAAVGAYKKDHRHREKYTIVSLEVLESQYRPEKHAEELMADVSRRYIEVCRQIKNPSIAYYKLENELGPLWLCYHDEILPRIEQYAKQLLENEERKRKGEILPESAEPPPKPGPVEDQFPDAGRSHQQFHRERARRQKAAAAFERE